jgi:hypothetical protein
MERSCPTKPHPRRPRASARRVGFEPRLLDGAARSTTAPAPIPTPPYLTCYAARPLSTSVSLACRSGGLNNRSGGTPRRQTVRRARHELPADLARSVPIRVVVYTGRTVSDGRVGRNKVPGQVAPRRVV